MPCNAMHHNVYTFICQTFLVGKDLDPSPFVTSASFQFLWAAALPGPGHVAGALAVAKKAAFYSVST